MGSTLLARPLAPGLRAQEAAPAVPDDSVAVIPFSNITRAPGDDWIGSGIAETVTADLEHVRGLSVIGRQAVSEALESLNEGQGSDPHARGTIDAGRRLGARWLVDGGYQRMSDRIRITARVVDVETGTVVETVKVDGAVSELFALQDRIVAELRRGLAVWGDAVATPSVTSDAGVGFPRGSTSRAPGPAAPTGPGLAPLARNVIIDGPPPPIAPEVMARDAEGRVTWRATRLSESLSLDGNLDEAIYEQVPPASGFIQMLPDAGEPATEKTEAWVFYDGQNVYVTARCWDSAPESQWVANEMRRDTSQLRQNDTFMVMFDTFYDRRNGVALYVNPIGGFADYAITDERSSNTDWNPVWEVRTGRFEGGWTVEMAIPFKSLRYRPGTSQIWGIQLRRVIRRKNEWAHLTRIPLSGGRAQGITGVFRVSAAATLVGLEAPAGAKNLEIKPYGISGVTTDLTANPQVSNDVDGDWGLDVKYGLSQNLTADFTYNTDFAQVEVDEQQVNLTRFSLFFPEKREFFLEGRGIFDFGRGGRGGRGGNTPTVFFSRRIGLSGGRAVAIEGGGRLTGRIGRFSIGALNIQTADEPTVGALTTNFTVVRVKRDILRRSVIGLLFTRRSISTVGAGSNEAYGVDAAFSFYDNVNFNGYYAQTRTPGLDVDDTSYQAGFSYDADRYGLNVSHLLVGDNFNPEVGFLRRDDFQRSFASFRYSPRPRSIQAVRQFTWQGSFDYTLNGANDLETRESQLQFNTEFENSDQLGVDVTRSYELLVDPFTIASGVTIPVGGYSFQGAALSYSLGEQRRVSGSFSVQHGTFFSGKRTTVGYNRGRIGLTPQFSLEPGVSINWVDLPEGQFTTKLVTSRVIYTFAPRMSFSGLLQYNSSDDSLSSNLRFRWEYQPGSELFVVYSDQRDTGARGFPGLENRGFVVKFNRLFRV